MHLNQVDSAGRCGVPPVQIQSEIDAMIEPSAFETQPLVQL
jgi:hypothetical protein